MNCEPDKLDRLLTEFFRAELPASWPAAPRPDRIAPVMLARSDSLGRSRFALAVSITALLLGGWWLAGRLSVPSSRPASFDETTATRPPEMRLGK
jgi:hypothetical protein